MSLSDQNHPAFQQLRSEEERGMPEWRREALDRQRGLDVQRRLENPALYAQLDRIEAKLDKLLAGL